MKVTVTYYTSLLGDILTEVMEEPAEDIGAFLKPAFTRREILAEHLELDSPYAIGVRIHLLTEDPEYGVLYREQGLDSATKKPWAAGRYSRHKEP